MRLQAVRSVASDGKSYRLPPDKENTAVRHIALVKILFWISDVLVVFICLFLPIGAMFPCYRFSRWQQ